MASRVSNASQLDLLVLFKLACLWRAIGCHEANSFLRNGSEEQGMIIKGKRTTEKTGFVNYHERLSPHVGYRDAVARFEFGRRVTQAEYARAPVDKVSKLLNATNPLSIFLALLLGENLPFQSPSRCSSRPRAALVRASSSVARLADAPILHSSPCGERSRESLPLSASTDRQHRPRDARIGHPCYCARGCILDPAASTPAQALLSSLTHRYIWLLAQRLLAVAYARIRDARAVQSTPTSSFRASAQR